MHARVSDDLAEVVVEVRATVEAGPVSVFLGADRFRAPPEGLTSAMEPLLFRRGFSSGAFSALEFRIDGTPVEGRFERLSEGARRWSTTARRPGELVVRTRLRVPDRYGPFARRGRQLTLGGRWYPVVTSGQAPPIRTELAVEIPAAAAALVGGQWAPWRPGGTRRTLRFEGRGVLPLIVLPPETVLYPEPGRRGAVVWPRGRGRRAPDRRRRTALLKVLEDAAKTLPLGDGGPLWLVEAPLRKDLARAVGGGVVLVSDHAYRNPPLGDLDSFSDRALFRALALAQALRTHPPLVADIVAAAALDARARAAPDAFDVLGPFAFVPAVDNLLYAPQIPFVDTYFRVVQDDDPMRASLNRFPSEHARGRRLYEKLRDRVGALEAARFAAELRRGQPLRVALEARLGPETETFLRTWLGPYPKVAYRLGAWGSEPRPEGGFEAFVEIERLGAEVAEPVRVRLESRGHPDRVVVATATTASLRTLTATLSASLRAVTLDPEGRLGQTAHLGSPNPRLDDRSHPGWRVLLNSFNVLLGATAGTIDTALSFSFARRWDPTWRFGLSGRYAPEAASLNLGVRRAFGDAITPNQRASWVALSLTGERLLDGFAPGAAAAWAGRGVLSWGYDNRRTAWAPEAGLGLRARVGYARVISREGAAAEGETNDAVSVGVAALRSWRFGAAHTVSLRGRVDAWVVGRPRPQLLFDLGGRFAARGYQVGQEQGRFRALLAGEWLHPLLRDAEVDVFHLLWADRLDGAIFVTGAWITDGLDQLESSGLRADIGYGFRAYLDYLGVRPGVLAIDIALPLLDDRGRPDVGSPQIYIAFSQSFFAF